MYRAVAVLVLYTAAAQDNRLLWRASPEPTFRPPMRDGGMTRSEAIVQGMATPFVGSAVLDMPDRFEAAEQWPACESVINQIRDQGQCGSCWAVSTASASSDRMCIATNGTITLSLSAQHLGFCGAAATGVGNGCHGGFLPDAWKWLVDMGVVTGGEYHGGGPFGTGLCSNYCNPPKIVEPFTPSCELNQGQACPTKCDADAKPPHNNFNQDKFGFVGGVETPGNEADIQQSMMTGGPVTALMDLYKDLSYYAGGIYHHDASTSKIGEHAVRLVGWGLDNSTRYWKVANSYGDKWGEHGYFRILRGTKECNIESGVYSSSAVATWGKKGMPAYVLL